MNMADNQRGTPQPNRDIDIIKQLQRAYAMLISKYGQKLIEYFRDYWGYDKSEAEELARQVLSEIFDKLKALNPEEINEQDGLSKFILQTARDIHLRHRDKLFHDLITSTEGLAKIVELQHNHQLVLFYRHRSFGFSWRDICQALNGTEEAPTEEALRQRAVAARNHLERIHTTHGQS